MKDTFALITNIITLIVFFGTIIFAIANTIWKKQCEKKYKISADFFTYANKTGVLFNAAIIILLNFIILSVVYLNYKDSLYNIEIKNTEESETKNTEESYVYDKELVVDNKNKTSYYMYDSKESLLKNNDKVYKVKNIEGNRYCITDENLLAEHVSGKIKSIDDKSKPEEGYKRLRFEYSIDSAKDNNKTKVFMLQVQDNVKISDIINFVDQHKKLEGLYVKPGYYVSWTREESGKFNKNEIEDNKDDMRVCDFNNDTITFRATEKLINEFYYINMKDSNKLVAFKKTDIHWFFKIYICLYMIVICAGIYLFYMNILKKHNAKLIDKKLNYIYILIFATSIFVCCFFILEHNSNNYLACNYDLLTVLILIISIIMFIKGAYLMTIFQKKSCVMIFCAVLGAIITFYTLWALDLLIYILFNFYLLNIIVNVIIQTLAVMVGLVIIVVSYANLFINSIILDLESKYKLIHINNKNNYLDIPEDLAVISEYKNKFLAVRYENYGDELIVLYTDEYWFINTSDCIVKEESFKKELVVKGNDKLKLSTLDAIIRAEKNNIEELKYSREPIILYSNVETDKKPNIPKKDRHGLIINEDDYKIFKFKALLSDDKNSELSDNALKEYNMCLIKKGFKLEDINNEMLGLDTEYVLWYLRYKNKFWIKKDTVNAYFVKNGLEILINEDNENEPLPICFKLLIVIKDNTVKACLIEKYMDIKTVCELLNITERDIVIIENYESNNVIAQIVDKEKDILNNNAMDKDTKTHHTENNQSQNKSQDDNIK